MTERTALATRTVLPAQEQPRQSIRWRVRTPARAELVPPAAQDAALSPLATEIVVHDQRAAPTQEPTQELTQEPTQASTQELTQEPTTPALEVCGLTRRYDKMVAVDALSFTVPAGVVCGFVGPNGAGKTTTIRMLLGLVRPSAGTARVLGAPLDSPQDYLPRVGAMIEGPTFYPAMTARANLAALAALSGAPAGRVEVCLRTVGLLERADSAYRTFSLGMKQRLGIAAALLADPDLLILDEPTNGLDPAGIVEVRILLRRLADDGKTVFVSSHLLNEVEQIADHLVMVAGGQLKFAGTVAELLSAQSPYLLVRPERPEQHAQLLAVLAEAGIAAQDEPDDVDGAVRVALTGERAGWLNRLLMTAGVSLASLVTIRPSLEDAFFSMTTDPTDGPALQQMTGAVA